LDSIDFHEPGVSDESEEGHLMGTSDEERPRNEILKAPTSESGEGPVASPSSESEGEPFAVSKKPATKAPKVASKSESEEDQPVFASTKQVKKLPTSEAKNERKRSEIESESKSESEEQPPPSKRGKPPREIMLQDTQEWDLSVHKEG
jgi:hypothetical protein